MNHKNESSNSSLSFNHLQEIDSNLWILLATNYGCSEFFFKLVVDNFDSDPTFFCSLIIKSKNSAFISYLESKIVSAAPFVKYLPPTRMSKTFIWPHEFWEEGVSTYLVLNHLLGVNSPIDSSIFTDELPSEVGDWLADSNPKQRAAFSAFYNTYLEIEDLLIEDNCFDS